MREYTEYMARAAVCEQRAKEARTESEKQSWLVMADSWRETVKLQEMLTRHAEFIRKVPMPRAHRQPRVPILRRFNRGFHPLKHRLRWGTVYCFQKIERR